MARRPRGALGLGAALGLSACVGRAPSPALDIALVRTSEGPTWEFGDPPTPNDRPMF